MLKTQRRSSLWISIALLLPMFALIFAIISCETEKKEFAEVIEVPLESAAPAPAATAPDEATNEVFTIVEGQPEPVGGMAAFMEYVGSQIKYPEEAKKPVLKARYLFNLL
ncbi:MAG: hypothetical protein U5K79_16145 [Cyclobacteriaceae bacterium]|nr:hypothetical protein [Cyclobacteriaceae bacterium]